MVKQKLPDFGQCNIDNVRVEIEKSVSINH